MIVKSVVLPLSAAAAFQLFTQKISQWWPADRRHSQDPTSEIFLLESGRFYERSGDGREVELGHVRSWDFPSRILLDFFIATSPEQPTQVEITFATLGRGTEVTVVHGPKPSSEALWTQRAPRYERSWDAVLAGLVQATA
ncbi:SRPBCC domain-containing protein [Roseiarcaceae bacterium H3SJ34-1]|uniref:SRPBCC domain-containing protein n=1 Tax=Terripilifer ovatus TaxID=3032367 RepID=UPI003AB976BF|nr:SRPBCC domain-containing protein [Roseiarcaceae bacterium H3SJ34-1]